MKKVGLTQRRRTEKAIIDALLKISEIVQKTETSRQRQKSFQTHVHTKNPIGDGDFNEFDDEQQKVPLPPTMRTIDSYISDFNHEPIQKPLNSNQLSTNKSKRNMLNSSRPSEELDQQYDRSFEQENIEIHACKISENSNKRQYDDFSSTSQSNENDYRKKILKPQSNHKSTQSNKDLNPICQDIENQPTITTLNSPIVSYQVNSAATTIPDDQSSSVIPMNSTQTDSLAIVDEHPLSINSNIVHIDKQPQESSSISNTLTDFDLFMDQQVQVTLEKHFKSQTLLSTKCENIRQKRETRFLTLTKSETDKMMNQLNWTKPISNLENYKKQLELAMIATKQGNYSLSFSIYTKLLHDSQYDYKLKSEILASRASTLFLQEKYFESIDDCTQSIAYNQWNKLAYIVRAACWMIKQEYLKAVEDYSKLFHFFDQTQQILDLLNLAYDKLKSFNTSINIEQSLKNEYKKIKSITSSRNPTQSVSPSASFMQPAVYLCYPYQACSPWHNEQQQQIVNRDEIQQPTYMINCNSRPSLVIDQSAMSSEQVIQNRDEKNSKSCQSIHSNNNAFMSTIERISSSLNKNLQSNLLWIKNPHRSY